MRDSPSPTTPRPVTSSSFPTLRRRTPRRSRSSRASSRRDRVPRQLGHRAPVPRAGVLLGVGSARRRRRLRPGRARPHRDGGGRVRPLSDPVGLRRRDGEMSATGRARRSSSPSARPAGRRPVAHHRGAAGDHPRPQPLRHGLRLVLAAVLRPDVDLPRSGRTLVPAAVCRDPHRRGARQRGPSPWLVGAVATAFTDAARLATLSVPQQLGSPPSRCRRAPAASTARRWTVCRRSSRRP
jgi:hypothetical protein